MRNPLPCKVEWPGQNPAVFLCSYGGTLKPMVSRFALAVFFDGSGSFCTVLRYVVKATLSELKTLKPCIVKLLHAQP